MGDKREVVEPLLDGNEIGAELEKAQERASLTPVLLTVAVVLLGPFSFGYCMGFTSPILPALTEELQLSTGSASLYGALVNVGAMVGAVTSGHLADSLGRKRALAVACVAHIVGWVINTLATTIWVLDAGRLLVGVGTGIVSFAVPVYIAETAPIHLRGALGACNQLAVTIGILSVYMLGLALPWRPLALVGAVPPTLLLLGLLAIPETPTWLGKHGTRRQLEASLRKLRGPTSDVSGEMLAIQESIALTESSGEKSGGFRDLTRPQLRRPLLVGVGLMVLQQLSGANSVTFYTGTIFLAAGFRTNANLAGCYVMAVQVVMTGVAASLMDRAGRRALLLVSTAGLALTSFGLGLSFYFESLPADSLWAAKVAGPLALLALLLYIASFALGMGAVPWLIMSEVFPANVRGPAGSLAVLVNWGFSFIVTETFGYLLNWSAPGAFWLYAGICLLGLVFVSTYVPETRGKSLEEIEAFFARH